MTNGQKLRIGGGILLSKLTGKPRPFFVQYSLLNACNAKCVYCNCPEREDPRASLEQHLTVLAEFARLGAVRIKFLGGEPLLHRDIGVLVAAAKSHAMRTAIVTNGFLIPSRMDLITQF